MVDVVWSPIAIPGLLAGIAGWTMAVVVYRAAPGRMQNRLLAAAMAADAMLVGAFSGVAPLLASAPEAFAIRGVEYSFQIAAAFLYLAFLGTLDSPLARPLRSGIVRGILVALALATFAAWPLLSPLLLEDGFVTSSRAFLLLRAQTPLSVWIDGASGVLGLFAFAVAVDAWRRAPASSARRAQARAYGLAFGVRDLIIGTRLIIFALLPGLFAHPVADWISFFSFSLGNLLGTVLLAYGVLKTQLFDVDLRLKWTIRRGTLASAFVAAFLVASAVAEQYLQQYGVLVGGLAVGLLLLALRPLERAADRLADRAMPNVQDTAAYRADRKRALYRAALDEALEAGDVSHKERAILARLAEALGLGPVEMHEIEREARSARGL